MKKILVLLALTVCVFACTQIMKKHISSNYFCGIGTADTVCPGLPYEVNEIFGVGYSTSSLNFTDSAKAIDSTQQTPLDLFSWQTFVALNWPSDSSGNATGSIYSDNLQSLRVWEHYKDPLEVFNVTGGLASAAETPLVLHLNMAKQQTQKFFYMASKSFHGLAKVLPISKIEQADGLPLIDRNGNFTLYEIKLNSVEDTFITNNKLTTLQGIYKYNPNGFTMPASDSSKGNPGAMEIKASWRILTAADDTSRFYCRTAVIYIDAAHTTNHKPLTIPGIKVGLVGMHIIRHTPNVGDQLIWTTFEHADNAPDSLAKVDTAVRWSYYNPACTACIINGAPQHVPSDSGKYIWSPVQPYASLYTANTNGYGTQVERVYKVFKYTDSVNKVWRKQLKGTVWANYRLVGTQWQKGDSPSPKSAPPLLGNTTLETYMQSYASCISCHGGASITYVLPTDTSKKYNVNTGMSFVFPVYAY